MPDPRLRRFLSPVLLVAASLVTGLAPATAQSPSGFALGVAGGGSIDGDLSPGLPGTTRLEPGWLAGAYAEYGFGSGTIALRLNGLYARRTLDGAPGSYDAATVELGALYRPFVHAALVPFGAVSGGMTFYQGTEGSPLFADGAFGEEPVGRVHVALALGAERALSQRLAVRLELGDRIVFPSVGESPPTDGRPTAHTPFALLGLQFRPGAGERRPPGQPPVARTRPTSRPVRAEEPPPVTEADETEEVEEVEEVEEIDEVEAAPPPPAAARPPAPDAAAPALYTVQVGSFMELPTAERWLARIEELGVPVWLAVTEIQGQEVARVRVGATATDSAARALASFLDREYGWPLSVEPVGTGEPVPAGAAARTAEFLTSRGGG